MKKTAIISMLLFILAIGIASASTLCQDRDIQQQTYVTYANNSPATEANVTMQLWNATIIQMLNEGGGYYNATFHSPFYSPTSSNSYYLLYISQNPNATTLEEITIDPCQGEAASSITENTILFFILVFFWLALLGLVLVFRQMILGFLMLGVGLFLAVIIFRYIPIGGIGFALLDIACFMILGGIGNRD